MGTTALYAQGRSTADGVFSAAQAAAGKATFGDKCAMCHGADLNGQEMVRPCRKPSFIGNWAGQSVGDLVTRIHTTMPANDPSSLSDRGRRRWQLNSHPTKSIIGALHKGCCVRSGD